jgi:predicted NACHT family NTPase
MSEYLQAAVQRVLAGSRDEADLMAIATAIQTGQVTWASGKGAIGVGGDVVNSLIVPGSYNIINSTIVLEREAAIAIQALLTQRLGITPTAAMPLDELLQQVRSRASTKVLNLFSQIQLLNKRQVAVDQLYVDIYVLELRDFHATISGLLEGQDAREQFDRFGLGKRGERLSGLAITASEDFPRLMVLGKPGSGKSTFLRHLAVSCAKGEFLGDYSPVLLELRDVDEAAFSLFQYLHGEFGLEQEAQTEQILKQGRVLLLLDGLDEVPSSLRQRVQHELRKFTKRYDKNRFILTCRTQTTEYIPEQFQAVEVADFKPGQVECFALHWFTAMAGTPEQGMALKNQFMEKLRESPQTAELAVTPVLLSLTCWIFDDMKGLPQKRSDLYREGLDLLLQQWDEGRGISRDSGGDRYHQLTTEERKQLLSYVAVRKFEQAENFVLFEESELCGYIAEYLQVSVEESRAVLGAIAQQHGLLIERAQDIWSFSHLTFQEYLVAKGFCDQADWQSLGKHITETSWKEVFLLTVEMLSNSNNLLHVMKSNMDQMMADDKKLQQYLAWLREKSSAINIPDRVSVVRLIYFERTLAKHRALNLDFSPVLALDQLLSYALDLAIACPLGLGRPLEIPFVIALTQALNLQDPDIVYDLDVDLVLNLILVRALNYAFNQDLNFELQALRTQLPKMSLENKENREQWWKKKGHVWAEELRIVMIKHQNIGHNWQFSEKQEKQLRLYDYVLELVAKCTNQPRTVGEEIKQYIEDNFLLPIAEIEKRKNQSSN